MTRRSGSVGPWFFHGFLAAAGSLSLPSAPAAQVGTVQSEQKISETTGGFGGVLDASDHFGGSVAFLGDLDGDGNGDLAVGAPLDGDQGAVWILFMGADGTVVSEQKISESTGGFGGDLNVDDEFGWSVAALGDLDGDGVGDLAVGARHDDDGTPNEGAVWILFLNADGTVASEQQISRWNEFGCSVASLGDLDGDGNQDLAVGARLEDGATFPTGPGPKGGVWILFLNSDGTFAAQQLIKEVEGGFDGVLGYGDDFGWSVAALGDLDGDGNGDLAVGSRRDDDGGSDQGAVWILFLNADGTVASEQKISETAGGFGGVLDPGDRFGSSVASPGDLDGDGNQDLAVGAIFDDDGGTNHGAVWVLFLNADGTVSAQQKISETSGGFGGVLDPSDQFGGSLTASGSDLVAGAFLDDDGDIDQGAIWVLSLEKRPKRKHWVPSLPATVWPSPVFLPPIQVEAPGPSRSRFDPASRVR